MRFGSYCFSARFLDEARLPEYKGSTFRGGFGHALRSVVCALRRRTCTDCLLTSRCLYPFVFETSPTSSLEGGRGNPGGGAGAGGLRRRIAARPHPYVIEAPPGDKIQYGAGEVFTFHLLLFGQANDSLPYFIYAFNEVGKSGIGSRVGGQRAKFSLVSVAAAGHTFYDGADNRMFAGDVTEDLNGLLQPLLAGSARAAYPAPATAGDEPFSTGAEAMPFSAAAPGRSGPSPREPRRGGQKRQEDELSSQGSIEVELLTPLRLKYENHLGASLPFHVLIRAALRRVSSLCRYHGNGEPRLDYRGLAARAQSVTSDETGLSWFDWERYSSRQDQRMLMGGLVGRVRYIGEIGEFLPLLRFCEKVHLGKQTTFGLGHISLKMDT